MTNHVPSLSGGKDSTAMLLEMLERGEDVHSVMFFDTEWEFPQMYDHLAKLEEYTGIKIWRLHSCLPFDYWLTARPVIARKGEMKGKVHRIGNGWPSPSRRWCTRQKADVLDKYVKPIPDSVTCVGYAVDEADRAFCCEEITVRFPLQEYGITEADALKICKRHGFDWGGLYDHFRRVSCFCCPLQRLGELRTLRKHFPELWQRMLDMEEAMGEDAQRGFREYVTVSDLDRRFDLEDQQCILFSEGTQ